MNNIYKIATYYRKLKQKRPILYQFLNGKKALKAFAKNCRYENYPLLIVTAFSWDKTKEGGDFWSKLDREYGEYEYKLFKEL